MLIALIGAAIVLLALRLSTQAASGNALTGAERELQNVGGIGAAPGLQAPVAVDVLMPSRN